MKKRNNAMLIFWISVIICMILCSILATIGVHVFFTNLPISMVSTSTHGIGVEIIMGIIIGTSTGLILGYFIAGFIARIIMHFKNTRKN